MIYYLFVCLFSFTITNLKLLVTYVRINSYIQFELVSIHSNKIGMYKFLWSHKTIEICISSTWRLQLVVNKLRWEKPKLSIWNLMFFKDIIRLKVFCCLIVWLWEFYAHVKRKNIHGVLMQKHMTLQFSKQGRKLYIRKIIKFQVLICQIMIIFNKF